MKEEAPAISTSLVNTIIVFRSHSVTYTCTYYIQCDILTYREVVVRKIKLPNVYQPAIEIIGTGSSILQVYRFNR